MHFMGNTFKFLYRHCVLPKNRMCKSCRTSLIVFSMENNENGKLICSCLVQTKYIYMYIYIYTKLKSIPKIKLCLLKYVFCM